MYKHITSKDRAFIAQMIRNKKTFKYIAQKLGVSVSTISREYYRNRNWDGTYSAIKANKRAEFRFTYKQGKHKIIENNSELYDYVVTSLEYYWSPEQISGRLKLQSKLPQVSHKAIYSFIERERKDLKKYRRHKRHRKLSKISYKQGLKHMIDEREDIVDKRSRIGDWEGDTIVGKNRKERILTHVERKSGLLIANRTSADSYSVWKTTKRIFKFLPVKTITYDNGVEFSAFENIERDTNAKVYFAYPGKPHQRGTNENCNGLLRQFFPKGTSFDKISQRQLDEIVALINNRPRKRLGYRTPLEVFLSEVKFALEGLD